MAKEEKKGWTATKKFYPQGNTESLKFKLIDAETRWSEKNGLETIKPAKFLTVTPAGYVPQSEDEENRLIEISKNPATNLIEEAQLPKSADVRALSSSLTASIDERKQLEKKNEEYKAMLRTNGIKVED